ncbi:MAG: hypothetical protein IKS31_06325 [Clostridia bacterium]|nr:hypothetical protein [Clostridia bacterium]
MKRCFFILCAVLTLLLACCAAACADVPAQVMTYFSEHQLGDASVMGTAELTGHGKDDCLFVVIRTKKDVNILYCFKYSGSEGWKHSFHNQGAVPQGKNDLSIYISSDMHDWANGRTYKGPLLVVNSYGAEDGQLKLFTAYQLNSGKWKLKRIWSYTNYESMELNEGSITYFTKLESGTVKGTAHGTYQRDVRYVSLSAIPKNLSAAQKGLTSAPTLPVSAELNAQEIQFTGGKKYNVYTAPDKTSIRGGNGKAAVSTNGWIQVFGREGDWILVQYSIDRDRYRFGYISAKSLPKKASVPDLHFNAVRATLVKGVMVTDDPLYSRLAFTSEPAGMTVTWLATMGDWAYIQGARYRGFVPVSALSTSQAVAQAAVHWTNFYTFRGDNGLDYDQFVVYRLHYDAARKVYAVTGRFERIVFPAGGDEEPYGESANGGAMFTFTLAPDFVAWMIRDMSDGIETYMPVTDLYKWWIDAYLGGDAPEGEMTFMADLPEADWDFADVDFWFFTTKIELNENNQIRYMEYSYVPWG